MTNKKEIIKKVFLIISLAGTIGSMICEKLFENGVIHRYNFSIKLIFLLMLFIAITINVPSE